MSEKPNESAKNNVVWIVLAIVLVLLCCCLVLFALGGIVLVSRSGQGQFDFSLPFIRPTPTESEEIEIEPFNPTTTAYPFLQELVPGWEASKVPVTQTWQVQVRRYQAVVILLGWCTDTKETLEQNFQHIHYSMTIDGKAVDVSDLYRWDSTIRDGVCRSYVGIIREWPGESHRIVTTMEITELINDGWDDYPPGEYTDVYEVTVTR